MLNRRHQNRTRLDGRSGTPTTAPEGRPSPWRTGRERARIALRVIENDGSGGCPVLNQRAHREHPALRVLPNSGCRPANRRVSQPPRRCRETTDRARGKAGTFPALRRTGRSDSTPISRCRPAVSSGFPAVRERPSRASGSTHRSRPSAGLPTPRRPPACTCTGSRGCRGSSVERRPCGTWNVSILFCHTEPSGVAGE